MKAYRTIRLVWICTSLFFSTAVAQVCSVRGRILDEGSAPIAGAMVRLVEPGDSLHGFVTTTNLNGEFSFDRISQQSYILMATAVGRRILSMKITVRGALLELGSLTMSDEPIPVRGVTITGRLPAAVQVGDTTEYAASAVKVNRDATMGDLLSKLPGIIVSNGSVTAGGEAVQQVLVDGKPFFGQDPSIALSNIPADEIATIQVYDQQSDQAQFTGFDDGQSIRTINVITRRRRGRLNFGKAAAGYGENRRYDFAGNLNLFDGNQRLSLIGGSNNTNQQDFSTQDILGVISNRSRVFMPGSAPGFGRGGPRRMNTFGGSGGISPNNQLIGQQQGINTTSMFGVNESDTLTHGLFAQGSYFFNQINNQNLQDDHRLYLLGGDSTSLYNQNSNVSSRNFNNRVSARVVYTPDESNSVIFLPVLYFQSNRSANLLDATSDQGALVSQSSSNTAALNQGYNMTGHLILRHRFDLPGRTISLDIGAGANQKQTDGNLYSSDIYSGIGAPLPDSTLQQSGYLSNSETISASLIYTEPTDVNALAELSYSPSYMHSTATKNTFDFDPITGGYTSLDLPLSNAYSDNYMTQNVGIGYRWRSGGVNIMGRVSYQYADLQGYDSTGVRSGIARTFSSILPSAMLMYRTPDRRFLRIFFRTFTNPPDVTQLQQVVDNSNPLLLTTGNPNLGQSYSSMLMARYNLTVPGSSQSMFLFASATGTAAYVANSTIIPTRDTVLSSSTKIPVGSQLTYPVNMNGYWNARTFFTYGFPFDLIESIVNLSAGGSYTRTPGIINGITSASNTIGPTAGIVVGSDISENFDFTLSYMGNYNFAGNSLLPGGNNNYYSHTASLKWYIGLPLGFYLNNQISNVLTSGLAAGYNQNIVLWNITLAKLFIAHDRGELQLTVNDVLGQNKSVNRTITDTYIDDTNNEVLTRFAMLTFSYTVR